MSYLNIGVVMSKFKKMLLCGSLIILSTVNLDARFKPYDVNENFHDLSEEEQDQRLIYSHYPADAGDLARTMSFLETEIPDYLEEFPILDKMISTMEASPDISYT